MGFFGLEIVRLVVGLFVLHGLRSSLKHAGRKREKNKWIPTLTSFNISFLFILYLFFWICLFIIIIIISSYFILWIASL